MKNKKRILTHEEHLKIQRQAEKIVMNLKDDPYVGVVKSLNKCIDDAIKTIGGKYESPMCMHCLKPLSSHFVGLDERQTPGFYKSYCWYGSTTTFEQDEIWVSTLVIYLKMFYDKELKNL